MRSHAVSCMRVYDFIEGRSAERAEPPCARPRTAQGPRLDILRANASAIDLFQRHQRALLQHRSRRRAATAGRA